LISYPIWQLWLVPQPQEKVMAGPTRETAEIELDKITARASEIKTAMQQELARQEAAVKNMHRLRLLRLQRDELREET
jgi:hypothetical protein